MAQLAEDSLGSVKGIYSDVPFPNRADRSYKVTKLDRMEKWLSHVTPFDFREARVIELGCGTGELFEAIQSRYPQCHLVAVDFSDTAIRLAKKNLAHSLHVEYLEGDIAEAQTFPRSYLHSFDLVICSGVYHHLHPDSRRALLSNACSLLREGGLAYFWIYGLGRVGFDTVRNAILSLTSDLFSTQAALDIARRYADHRLREGFCRDHIEYCLNEPSELVHAFLDPIADCISFSDFRAAASDIFAVDYVPQLDDVNLASLLPEALLEHARGLPRASRRRFVDHATRPMYLELVLSGCESVNL